MRSDFELYNNTNYSEHDISSIPHPNYEDYIKSGSYKSESIDDAFEIDISSKSIRELVSTLITAMKEEEAKRQHRAINYSKYDPIDRVTKRSENDIHGSWVKNINDLMNPKNEPILRCGRCCAGVNFAYPYCPWCGAKMDGMRNE